MSKISRRDVVNVSFGSKTKDNHLAVVLSPEQINTEEEQFLGIMITDSEYYDSENEFSFPLTNEMFTKPLKESKSRIRLYLINFLPASCVIGTPICQMKVDYFQMMIKDLNLKIFGVAF